MRFNIKLDWFWVDWCLGEEWLYENVKNKIERVWGLNLRVDKVESKIKYLSHLEAFWAVLCKVWQMLFQKRKFKFWQLMWWNRAKIRVMKRILLTLCCLSNKTMKHKSEAELNQTRNGCICLLFLTADSIMKQFKFCWFCFLLLISCSRYKSSKKIKVNGSVFKIGLLIGIYGLFWDINGMR